MHLVLVLLLLLSRTFDLYQTYFSLSTGDSILEEYYAKFSDVL